MIPCFGCAANFEEAEGADRVGSTYEKGDLAQTDDSRDIQVLTVDQATENGYNADNLPSLVLEYRRAIPESYVSTWDDFMHSGGGQGPTEHGVALAQVQAVPLLVFSGKGGVALLLATPPAAAVTLAVLVVGAIVYKVTTNEDDIAPLAAIVSSDPSGGWQAKMTQTVNGVAAERGRSEEAARTYVNKLPPTCRTFLLSSVARGQRLYGSPNGNDALAVDACFDTHNLQWYGLPLRAANARSGIKALDFNLIYLPQLRDAPRTRISTYPPRTELFIVYTQVARVEIPVQNGEQAIALGISGSLDPAKSFVITLDKAPNPWGPN